MGSRRDGSAFDITGGAAARRADFAQAQKQYNSRKRFGQTSTRNGGLTPEQIGEAPGTEDDYLRRRRAGGFGGAATLG